ncbi:hypothetical protein JB92DRAFT_3119716 [Gautieria morchelliformis]|nr:hypothetical protein JB92DRAFT_3119716 [Gautieria morchelliformis]
MPPLKKRSRQAKQQRVSGGKCFDAGLADALLDVEMDPTYSPEGGPEEADDVEFDADFPWAFSLLEPTEEAGTDEEGPVELVQVGSKRNVDRFEEEDSKDETGGLDLEAECAEAAVRKTCEFWKKVFASVSQTQGIKRDPLTRRFETRSPGNLKKLSKKLPVTYSGMSQLSCYAKQKVLSEAAAGSAKITVMTCLFLLPRCLYVPLRHSLASSPEFAPPSNHSSSTSTLFAICPILRTAIHCSHISPAGTPSNTIDTIYPA